MERREFMGSMMALFCAVALPEELVEEIQLIQPIELIKVPGEVQWTDEIDQMLKEIYCQPIMDQVVTSSQVYNQLVAAMMDGVVEDEPRYTEMHHYFELPTGWRAVDEGLTP